MSAAEILAFAVKCGLTVADLKIMSIGFLIDYCTTKIEIDSGEKDDGEEKYLTLKNHIDIIQEKYERGEISDDRYNEFMTRYKGLREEYGFEYD